MSDHLFQDRSIVVGGNPDAACDPIAAFVVHDGNGNKLGFGRTEAEAWANARNSSIAPMIVFGLQDTKISMAIDSNGAGRLMFYRANARTQDIADGLADRDSLILMLVFINDESFGMLAAASNQLREAMKNR